jgi:hypothetical protein
MTAPRRRWFQFSLRTVLALLTVVPLAAWGTFVVVDIRAASKDFDAKVQRYMVGICATDEACEASKRLRDCERRLPFAEPQAGRAHLERLNELRSIHERHCGSWRGADGEDPELEMLDQYAAEAKAWLAGH